MPLYAATDVPGPSGKGGHRGDGPSTECQDVGKSGCTRRRRQSWEHTDKMRATCHAVQHAQAEGGMRVPEPPYPRGPGVHVQVVMRSRAVRMR